MKNIKINISFILLACLFIFQSALHGQLPNQAFYDLSNRDSIVPERIWKDLSSNPKNSDKIGQQVYLDFQSLFFVRNNEYFSNIDPGETLFGYQFIPSLVWQPYKNHDLLIKGGAYLQRNFGDNNFAVAQPTFTLDYKIKNSRIVFGTLYGGLEHRLIEPLYRFERGLNDRLENGMQYIYKSNKFFVDAWVNWRQTTSQALNKQEIIEPGVSLNYTFIGNKESAFKSHFIFQLTNHHAGGSLVEIPLKNLTNAAIGLDFKYKKSDKLEFNFNPFFVHSLDHSIVIQQPFKDGMGLYVNAGVRKNHFNIILSYWKGWEYFSNLGTPMFNSFYPQNFYSMERERELLFLRCIYTLPLIKNNFVTDLRLEPIYDLKNKAIDYSFGIYFIYRMGL